MRCGAPNRAIIQGNNNAYGQNNAVSWFDWDLVTEHQEMVHFWQKPLHWMQSLRLFEEETRLRVEPYPVKFPAQHPSGMGRNWGNRAGAMTAIASPWKWSIPRSENICISF